MWIGAPSPPSPLQYLDHTNPWAVRLVLLAVGMVLITSFFVSFYHFHDWRFSESILNLNPLHTCNKLLYLNTLLN